MEIKISEFNEKDLKNIRIVKNVYKGYGLSYINSKTVFVEKAAEDDIVEIEILYKKSNSYFAKISKIIKPSKFRINNIKCNVFSKCGGCDWLYINYQKQLEIKKSIVSDLFKKFQIKITPSKNIYHYRNKNFMPVSTRDNIPIIGMYQRNSHNVISHTNCFLIPKIFDEINSFVKAYLIKSKAKIYNEKTHSGTFRHIGFRINSESKILIILVTKNSKIPFSNLLVKEIKKNFKNVVGIIQNINRKKGNRILGDEEKILFGDKFFFEKYGKYVFKLDYSSFSQINYDITVKLYEYIKEKVDKNDLVIDAFCGVGTIGIFLSDKVKKVYLIENNINSYYNLKENIKINNVTNCIPVYGDANKEMLLLNDKKINTVIFDPPRKGIDKETLQNIPKNIRKIIYVSCNPLTQKRDVDLLMEKGFIILNIQLFDMFPNTYHIETVILLERI